MSADFIDREFDALYEKKGDSHNTYLMSSAATKIITEYTQLRTLQNIQEIVRSRVRGNNKLCYEVDNILERWVLCTANHADKDIILSTDAKSPANIKMISELLEKSIVLTENEANNMIHRIIKEITSSEDNCCNVKNYALSIECKENNGNLNVTLYEHHTQKNNLREYNLRYKITPRIRYMIDNYPTEHVLRMIIRYDTLLGRGNQWGLPSNHFHLLYDYLGVRNEGFASPLNSRLMDMPETKYCSLFGKENVAPDTIFGSIGNFFQVDMLEHSGNWQINPPFIVSILDACVDKIISTLSLAKSNVEVFILLPAWTDMDAYIKLKSSRYLVHMTHLKANHYRYELPDGSLIVSRTNSIYMALASHKISVERIKLIRNILGSINTPHPIH